MSRVFFLGKKFQYIDPADEEMDDGFVFSPVRFSLSETTFFWLKLKN